MKTLNNNEWRGIRQLAAELTIQKADRNVIEKVTHHILTVRPQKSQLLSWLEAFEQDGYLGARSQLTWHHHRIAHHLTKEILDWTGETYTLSKTALILSWIARQMVYYRTSPRLAYEELEGQNRLLQEFNPNERPPAMPLLPTKSRKVLDDVPEVREQVDPFAEAFMRKLRGEG